jgi:16S rRNA (cytosine967-C5)-methyltransferase
MRIAPARFAAYDCLVRTEKHRVFSSTLLPEIEEKLSLVDRALCHELVLGVLRRQILLDAYIDKLTAYKRLDREIRIILRLGLFQIAYLERVPDHAVVNDSVDLSVRAKKSSAKGLVNAVLRHAARGLPELSFENEIDRIATETSHPPWLLRRWTDQFGLERAREIAIANNQPPELSFRKTLLGRDIEISNKYRSSENVDGCFFADSMNTELRDLASKGLIYFQDAGSQLVANAVELKGERFLDVCASPGGKTTAIASRSENGRPTIFAGDVTDRRVGLLKDTCRRQGAGSVNIVRYDASEALPFADRAFHSVLVDTPCTGTGTIRHNPEIRYFLTEADLISIPKLQMSILQNASTKVCPGGTLTYSTCSLETEENEEIAAWFLDHSPEFRKIRPKIPERFVTANGFARTFPSRDLMDGFFIATFERA